MVGRKKPLTITQPGMGKPQGNKEDDQLMEFENFRKQPLSQSTKNLLCSTYQVLYLLGVTILLLYLVKLRHNLLSPYLIQCQRSEEACKKGSV